MKRITSSILAILATVLLTSGISTAYAQYAQDSVIFSMGMVLTMEVNGTTGCAVQSAVVEKGGFCWELGFSSDTHRLLIDRTLGKYSDIRLLSPWMGIEADAAYRMFEFDDEMFLVMVMPNSEYRSSGVLLRFFAED